ncbi:hypothetical protein FE257_010441 [Aspergillus nanangensis]|uniref:Choline transport protein n=1 Tax=Aspergillus nanangensis TaxID=2582783 RepID=A0AAD4GS22_ASPNN|nr:hypothetical protein FE257_010441 [Aspergillus nanangensis]
MDNPAHFSNPSDWCDTNPTEPTLKRHFGIWSCLSVGLNTLNLFGGISFIITTAFSVGGIPAVLYGYIGASVGAICITVIFIECASLYPTAGGSYHFTSFLTPNPYRRPVSYTIGWFNYIGWVLTFAACSAITSSLIFATVNLFDDSFDVFVRWRLFLGYVACTTAAWAINTFAIEWTPFCSLVGGWAGTLGFVTYTIALLVVSPKQSVEFVFQDIVNETGYSSNAMAVCVGLFSATTVWQCLDAPTHIAEEIAEPTKVVPRVLVLNGKSTFWFKHTVTEITDNRCQLSVPILELVRQATGSKAATVVFTFIQITVFFASTLSCATTASRQGLAFAKDGGFPFGEKYLFSPQGFNAILGGECAFLLLRFGSPALAMLLSRRSEMPTSQGKWALGYKAYYIAIVACMYSLFVSVLVLIPQQHPLTALSMNYTIVIVGIFCAVIVAEMDVGGEGPADVELSGCRRQEFAPPKKE